MKRGLFWTTLAALLLAGCLPGRHAPGETPLQAAKIDYLTVVEAAAYAVGGMAAGTREALEADAITPDQAERMLAKLESAGKSVKAARERYNTLDDPTALKVGLGVLAAEIADLARESGTLGIAAAGGLQVYLAVLEAARREALAK